MKVVIAPDSFKESLSAAEAAQALAEGVLEIFPQAHCVCVPMADGGEGTVDAVVAATGGRKIPVRVSGPMGDAVDGFYGLSGDGCSAVIEMAAACGLALVPPARRNPLCASSRGMGRLIRAALDAGARRLLLGMGGSATNDGGAGMLCELGARLLDADGRDIDPTGEGLGRLAAIDASGLDPRLRTSVLDAACDVDNPLCGPQGASAVFGPQKGATPEMVRLLDANLRRFRDIARRDTGFDMDAVSGAGAAGGMGGAVHAFLGARLRPGVDMVAEAVGLEQRMRGADFVLTGEGRIDGQTAHGKTPVGVARVARRQNIPVLAVGGSLGDGVEEVFRHGIDAVFGTVPGPCGLAEALGQGRTNLRRAARNVAAALALGRRLR